MIPQRTRYPSRIKLLKEDPIIKDIVEADNLFKNIKQISQGGSGVIYKVTDYNDKVYVLKIYRTGKSLDNAVREFQLVQTLNCKPSFPCYHTFYVNFLYPDMYIDDYSDEDPTELHFAVKSDYIEGPTLYELLGKQTTSELRETFKGLVKILCELHSLGIAHRDIKAENVILNKYRGLVLIDYDLSCSNAVACVGYNVGTLDYLSPRIVQDRQSGEKSMSVEEWKKSDVWSLGVLFYELAHGTVPFGNEAATREEILNNILKQPIVITQPKDDPELMNIIRLMLQRNPKDRPSACELVGLFS